MAEARRRGGRNSHGRAQIVRMLRLSPGGLTGAFNRLGTALEDVLSGQLAPQRASAAAAVAQAMAKVIAVGEMEQRLRDLERQIAERAEAVGADFDEQADVRFRGEA
jgi:hypothetical protein